MSKNYEIVYNTNCYRNNMNIVSVDLGSFAWSRNNMAYAFQDCSNLSSVNNINEDITNISYAFSNCPNLSGDIYIGSENITNATNCFGNTSLDKNVYIPFQNNGNYTSTYNSFINAGYSTTTRKNGVLLMDINAVSVEPTDPSPEPISGD